MWYEVIIVYHLYVSDDHYFFNIRNECPCTITIPLPTSHLTHTWTTNLKILLFTIKGILLMCIFNVTGTEPEKKVGEKVH